jgi:hypothetical protein
MKFIVICRDDAEEGVKGSYLLATRRQFDTCDEAERYASQVHPGREAIVVECPNGLTYPPQPTTLSERLAEAEAKPATRKLKEPRMTDAMIATAARTSGERFDDAISLSVWASRKLGIELTVKRAGRIFDKID